MQRSIKKKKRNKVKMYSFWFQSKKDQETRLSKKQIIEKYISWLDSKPLSYIQYKSIGDNLPRIFIYLKEAGKGGLESSMVRDEFPEVAAFLKNSQNDYLQNISLNDPRRNE